MKGVIVKCIEELIVSSAGKPIWTQILEKAGFSKHQIFLPGSDVADADVLKIIESTCAITQKSFQEVIDLFGDHWINVYTPRMYGHYFSQLKSAKELIFKLNDIHVATTRNIEGARPPKFEIEQISDKVLMVKYISHRGLIDIYISIVKGMARKFNEKIEIEKISPEFVKLTFDK